MDFGDVTEGNFTFDGEQASASQDAGPETEPYASMGWKAPKDPNQGNPKPGKKDNWEELSETKSRKAAVTKHLMS